MVDFLQIGDKLLVGTGFSTCRSLILSSFLSVISAKIHVNLPSFNTLFCSRMRNTSKDHCAFVSCWAFLCRFLSGFLAGPTCITYRVASGFFVFRRHLVCRIVYFLRGRQCFCPMVHTVSFYQLPRDYSLGRHRCILLQRMNFQLK